MKVTKKCWQVNMLVGDRNMIHWQVGNCEEELPKKPVGRLSVDRLPTHYRQLTDRLPQLPKYKICCEKALLHNYHSVSFFGLKLFAIGFEFEVWFVINLSVLLARDTCIFTMPWGIKHWLSEKIKIKNHYTFFYFVCNHSVWPSRKKKQIHKIKFQESVEYHR